MFALLFFAPALPVFAADSPAASALDFSLPTEFPAIDYADIARQNADPAFDTAAQKASRKAAKKIIRKFQKQLRKAHETLEAIAALPDTGRTFLNTVEAFDDFYNQMENAVSWPGFYAYVHPDPFMRSAGEEVDKFTSKYWIEIQSSRALFLVFKSVQMSERSRLTKDEKYLLDELVMDFEDGGVGLPDDKREKFKALSKEQSDLAIEFSTNYRSSRDTLAVNFDQLDGMDTDYIDRLDRTPDSLYILTLDYPVFMPYMDYGRNEDVRKSLLVKYRNRAKDKNIALLEKIIRLRQERTKLLGRPTYADYAISRRMAKTAKRAMQFLQDVRRRVEKKANHEMGELTALKRETTRNSSATFDQWDRAFYSKLLTVRKYDYNPQRVKEYFETGRVIRGLLDISQRIYNLKFKKVKNKFWHEDVVKYNVYSNGERIGEFYLDLFPRPNKYPHAAAWPIRPHKLWPDGRRQLPGAALVTNFPKPSPTRPSLLSFDDVEAFFHEYGHLLHGILSTTRFSQVSGTRVMRDFVEAPSQMFEKWLHDTAVLSTFARHYQTGEPIPPDLVERIVKSRNVTSGIETQRQLFYGIYDLTLHTAKKVPDVVKLWFDLKREIEGMEEIPGTYGPASFDHLMGYAAGYYGYLWSRMIAADMYETFRDHGGLLNPEEGVRLRATLLSQGGSKHPDELLQTYLGRKPKIDAFLRDLGVEE